MKEFGNALAQLLFIIVVMVAFAFSMATLSQWANPDTSASSRSGGGLEQGTTAAPSLTSSVAH